VHAVAPQSTSAPQLFFVAPHGTFAQVTAVVSGTHWQVDGEPTQLSVAPQAVQRAASAQPCAASVDTQTPPHIL
jgi:hypothetical protein